MEKGVEAGKKEFVGFELPGRTLGVIGLGAIGVEVANAATGLGMRVMGYDPGITVEQAKEATGWDLKVADDLQTTEPPTDDELSKLRELVAA